MTDEMYLKLKQPTRPPKEHGLTAALWVSGLLLAFLLAVALRGPLYRLKVQKYLMALSNSTVYAYGQDALPAEQGGVPITLSGDSAYLICDRLMLTGGGTPRLLAPFRQADMVLLYGDGSELRLWDVAPKPNSGQVRHTLVVDYTDGDGLRYCYSSTSLTLDLLLNDLEQTEPAG